MKKIATTLAFALPNPLPKPAGAASPKGTFRLTLALLGVLLAASAAFTFRRITQEEIIQLLRQSAVDGTAAYFTDSDRSVYLSASFREVYASHAYQPLWSENGQPAPQLDSLLSALGRADQEGLVPATYHLARLEETLAAIALHPDAEKVVQLDQLATAAYLTYAAHLSGGSMSPARLDTNWHVVARHLPLAGYLSGALREGTVGQSLAGLLPGAESGYPALKRELQRLKAIARRGGWPALPVTHVLQKNDSGQAVTTLRHILAATGDLDSARVDFPRFDADLQAGLRRFQGRHGLTPTGKVDKSTLRALNVPVGERIGQVTLNLERMRWLPRQPDDRFISVNIPEYKLRVVEQHRPVLEANVVVGKPDHATPIFADTLESIVFSPEWNVPGQIATREILPLVQRNPYYLQKNNFEVFDSWNANAKPVNPYSINWREVTPEHFKYRIVQKANGKNALGAVKFLFPNSLNIYIHDTPAKQLFQERRRAFSHGCVRLENPEKLAVYLLQNTGDWSPEKVQAQLHGTAPVKVLLAQPVKVQITYLTAFVQDGALQFRDDVYGYDPQQLAVLLP